MNDAIIYDNRIYREIGTTWNISIYSRFDTYLASTIHTVDRDENWIAINLTRYSLKLYNQQSAFLHYNVTLDPNYYPTANVFWSEWLAPNEVASNFLYPDHYKITLMHNETGTAQYVSYELNFNTDDILLISSSNTLFAVLQNINNLNSSINSQFTYVALNFTNTNSQIGNQTTIISLNFENINTTFDDMLLYQQNSFDFMNSSLDVLLLNSNNSFNFINSSLNTLYSLSSSSFVFMNSTLNVLMTQSENSFEFLNSSVNNIYYLSLYSFEALNSTLENVQTTMLQNFTFTNSQIANNQLEVLTQFSIVNSNVTNNSQSIISNLYAVNSSIANLISEMESNVLLVNDTIYSAVLDVSTNLALDSNMILGNISITYRQNEFLTELFKRTRFSDLLNWTDVGYNYSLIEDQVDAFTAVSYSYNESVNLLLEYNNHVESILLGYREPEILWLPSENVNWAIQSVATGEYLQNWTSIENKTMKYGTWSEPIPATPDDLNANQQNWMLIVITLAIFGIAAVLVIILLVQRSKATKKYHVVDSSTYKLTGGGY